jgi:hypothetical protein
MQRVCCSAALGLHCTGRPQGLAFSSITVLPSTLEYLCLSIWSCLQVVSDVACGITLPKPLGCPADVYNLMLRCWDISPEARGTFQEIRDILEGIHKVGGCVLTELFVDTWEALTSLQLHEIEHTVKTAWFWSCCSFGILLHEQIQSLGLNYSAAAPAEFRHISVGAPSQGKPLCEAVKGTSLSCQTTSLAHVLLQATSPFNS